MSGAVILMYHVVDAPRSPLEERYCCTPQRLAEHMRLLRSENYRVVDLGTFLSALNDDRSEVDHLAAVTFDDAFACTCRDAPPILREQGIPATIFVPSDRIGRFNDWMHARGFPRREIASGEQLAELSEAGIEIGSHSKSHPRLVDLDPRALREEIKDSREALQCRLGRSVDYFAYPYGLHDDRVRDEVEQAGYRAACSTRSGFNRRNEDRFRLRRIEVCGTDSRATLRRKLQFGINDVPALFALRYFARRLAGATRAVR